MLCQKCKTNEANTYIKQSINGELTELALCCHCAAELGYNSISPLMSFDNILGSLLSPVGHDPFTKLCPKCGASFEDISRSGKVGCMECYDIFGEKLLPLIQRIHGTTVHKGKSPGRSALTVQPTKQEIRVSETSILEQKKLQLKNAIAEQRFEDAAKLRDEIKEMENNG